MRQYRECFNIKLFRKRNGRFSFLITFQPKVISACRDRGEIVWVVAWSKKESFHSAQPAMPVVAFDVIGTLFALDVAIDQLAATFSSLPVPPRVAFYLWLWSALRDYFAASHAGPYVPLMTVLRASLPRTLLFLGYDVSLVKDEDYDTVMAAFKRLELAPGMLDAVKRLRKLGWEVWAVTNGGKEATVALLERTELLEFFGNGTHVQSCDELKLSKPHPKVYNNWMRTVVHQTQKIEVRSDKLFVYVGFLNIWPVLVVI